MRPKKTICFKFYVVYVYPRFLGTTIRPLPLPAPTHPLKNYRTNEPLRLKNKPSDLTKILQTAAMSLLLINRKTALMRIGNQYINDLIRNIPTSMLAYSRAVQFPWRCVYLSRTTTDMRSGNAKITSCITAYCACACVAIQNSLDPHVCCSTQWNVSLLLNFDVILFGNQGNCQKKLTV